jgi:hypothetical protein
MLGIFLSQTGFVILQTLPKKHRLECVDQVPGRTPSRLTVVRQLLTNKAANFVLAVML